MHLRNSRVGQNQWWLYCKPIEAVLIYPEKASDSKRILFCFLSRSLFVYFPNMLLVTWVSTCAHILNFSKCFLALHGGAESTMSLVQLYGENFHLPKQQLWLDQAFFLTLWMRRPYIYARDKFLRFCVKLKNLTRFEGRPLHDKW